MGERILLSIFYSDSDKLAGRTLMAWRPHLSHRQAILLRLGQDEHEQHNEYDRERDRQIDRQTDRQRDTRRRGE